MQLPSRLSWAALATAFALLVLGSAVHAQDPSPRNRVQVRTGFLGPQVARGPQGVVYLLWAKEGAAGHDLYLARRQSADGVLGQARRVNEDEGSVDWTGLDELRPALVAGPEGHVAVGWVDVEGDIQVRWFDPQEPAPRQWRLNSHEGNPVRGFVELDFDERGELYAVWLDARGAERGHEEPAHLYGVHLRDYHSRAREVVLTEGMTESVCGCCRPFLRASRDGAEVFFRNVDEKGYRDIHRLAGRFPDAMDELERIGPATWKIDACPMAGAVSDGRFVWWRDGSRGHSRIVEGSDGRRLLSTVVEDEGDWRISASPRLLLDSDENPMLLVPGRPHGRLLRREGGRWVEVSSEIPRWALSAVRLRDQVLLVGDENTELHMESLALER